MRLWAIDMLGGGERGRRRTVPARGKRKLVVVPVGEIPPDAAGAVVILKAPDAVMSIPGGG
jgi:hypothetical protein